MNGTLSVADLKNELAGLQRARWTGSQSVTYKANGVERTVTYRRDAELQAAIAALEQQIADLEGGRPMTVVVLAAGAGYGRGASTVKHLVGGCAKRSFRYEKFHPAGRCLNLDRARDVRSGDVITVGGLTWVAAYDAKAGQEVETSLVGVFELPKGTGALAQGAAAYWNATAKQVTGSGDFLLGAVVAAAGTDAKVVRVRLNGTAVAAE